ncbi:MAG: hypothetical protein AAFR83_10570, partial [Cyanobacteria bacterium J06629_18]
MLSCCFPNNYQSPTTNYQLPTTNPQSKIQNPKSKIQMSFFTDYLASSIRLAIPLAFAALGG